MSSTDGLLLLRSALSSAHQLDLLQFPTPPPSTLDPDLATKVHALPDATHIAFPSSPPVILPKSVPTRWQVNLGDDPTSPTYPLDALLFAFLHRDASVAEYIKASRDAGVEFVTVTDRRLVLDWVSGKSGIEGPPGRIRPLAEDSGAQKRAHQEGGAGVGGGEGVGAEFGLPVAKKGRYQPDRADLDKLREMMAIIDGPVYANILPSGIDNKGVKSGGIYKTRETVLRGDRINNFDSVRQVVAPRLRALYEAEKARQRASQSTGAKAEAPIAAAAASAGLQKRKNNTPIIIISPSSTALITMHNVKRFLEDAVFVESDVARQMGGSSTGRTEDVLQVHHAKTSSHGPDARKARYFVVDSVDALAKFGGVEEAWERVVCVMTTGQEWQFRPYKWSDPKQLFQHVKGIHVQWTTDKPDAKTANWNVTQLKIDRKARHVDKATVMSFWKALEGWIVHNKPNLQI